MQKGLVYKSTGSWYTVRDENGDFVQCKIKGNIRLHDIKSTNPVTVGDNVMYVYDEATQTGVIHEILNRTNYIIRRSSNLSKQYHIIAANVDKAYLIITLAFPEISTEFIDRFLITAEAYNIPVVLVFNKIDLYDAERRAQLDEVIQIYASAGYESMKISAVTKTGIDTLRSMMNNKINLIAGNSGVGKSTVINSIDDQLNLKTNAISDYHLKGKHTTTFSEMFILQSGGYIIDTPGIKGFGLIDFDKYELYHFFPEIFKHAAGCKFHNCIHVNEPECAVRASVEKGEIHANRYANYLKILHSENEKYR